MWNKINEIIDYINNEVEKRPKVLYGIENIHTGEITFNARGGAYQDKNAAYRKMTELGIKEHRLVEYKLESKERLKEVLEAHKKWLMTRFTKKIDGKCADLRYADLSGAKRDECTSFYALQCPEEGEFISYKKAHGLIVKLLICEDAKRSSATTRKCRCSKAKVLSITNIDGTDTDVIEVKSNYDHDFVYRIGETVEVKNFEEDRWVECAAGIHFFITREEAVNYN